MMIRKGLSEIITYLTGLIVISCSCAIEDNSYDFVNKNIKGLHVGTIEEVLQLDEDEIDLATAILVISKQATKDLLNESINISRYLKSIDHLSHKAAVLMKEETNPFMQVAILNHLIFNDLNYVSMPSSESPENVLFNKVMDNRAGYCGELSILYLAIAERIGLPMAGVSAPGHFFVRYTFGTNRINIETTRRGLFRLNSLITQWTKFPSDTPFFLTSLSKKQTIGSYLSGVGGLYNKAGKYEAAINLYMYAIELTPNSPNPYNNLADAQRWLGMYDKAKSKVNKALGLNPLDSVALANKAGIYKATGQLDQAERFFDMSLKIDPNNYATWNNLGILFHKKKEFERAESCFKRAIEILPNLGAAHDSLSKVYYSQKKYAEMIKHFDLAVKYGYQVKSKYKNTVEKYR